MSGSASSPSASAQTATGQTAVGQTGAGQTATARLYTPQMLSLATGLAAYPPLTDAPLHGSARSDTCGGSLKLDLEMDDTGVRAAGMMVQACAVGQASAALFAGWVIGRSEGDVARSAKAVGEWLGGMGPLPTNPSCGPDLTPIEEAQAYPARHGAILLPWRAFADALRKVERRPA